MRPRPQDSRPKPQRRASSAQNCGLACLVARGGCLLAAGLTLAACGDVTLINNRGTTGILDVDLGEIAVVTGDYEQVEALLAEVEAEFTLVDGFIAGPPTDAALGERYAQAMTPVEAFLGEGGDALLFDTLFINCGVRGVGAVDAQTLQPSTTLLDDPAVLETLRTFVLSGGLVYVSDQSYGLVEAALPEAFDFRGADEVVGAALEGARATLDARVGNPVLSEAIGARISVQLTARWAMMHPVDGAWLVGDAPTLSEVEPIAETPLLVDRTLGDGRIVFSGFHNTAVVDQQRTELQVQMLRGLGGALR